MNAEIIAIVNQKGGVGKSFSCIMQFERINIMIGPNNSGKSNFIKALSFAANMVSNPKDETTGFFSELKRNGWQASSNRRSDDSSFMLREVTALLQK